MIGLTSLVTNGRPLVPPKLNRQRAVFVLSKIDEILAWEKRSDQERDVRFVELGRYLCEVRAGQYWRLDNLKSFDEFLERRFPDSRRKAYYLLAIHEHLTGVLHRNNVNLLETYITNFDFSPEFARAIESKQVAEQRALQARRDLDRIKIEAEQAIATSRAQAEALRMQRENVTLPLIELRKVEVQKLAIEKWNGVLPVTMMGGTMPFIDMSKAVK